ncbi:MAG TPA: glycoside hydrolase family 3 C-terminal domain-containing protein [Opitutaceae bacterium]|jgi:beta-glucosidase
MKRVTLPALAGLLCMAPMAAAQDTPAPQDTPAVEARVSDLLGRMTQDEKLSLIGGDQDFFIRAVPRLGLPAIKMADGPLGVRNWGPSTSYPATVGLAAAWDPGLARQFGAAVGSDARARGVNIMLGPAVDIARVPQNGRNFEYLSEDPYLNATMAVQIVEGMQSKGVVATVKHFAANNQETERDTIDARVGERALREIYLPAYRAAVDKGGAWAVMCAYNRLNGTYCSANDWLNNTVLKGDWGFRGVLMSDWGAAHDTLGAANGGLDLEMPSGQFMNPAKLGPLVASGKVSQATIDDKVRRILRLEVANGFLDRPQQLDTPKDDPKSDAAALSIARESIVLLKNERSTLPLNVKRLRRLVVVGPNSDNYPQGGGSSHVEPFHYVSLLEGLRKAAPMRMKVEAIQGPGPEMLDTLAKSSAYDSLKVQFLSGPWWGHKVLATLADERIDHDWDRAPAPGVDLKNYSAHWTATIRPPAAGRYIFLIRNHGGSNVKLDGKDIVGSWFNAGQTLYAEAELQGGRSYPIEVDANYDGQGSPAVQFGWGAAPPVLSEADAKLVRSADAAIVCVGYNLVLEGEGADRTFALPAGQDELIRRVASLNRRTIVVVDSGGAYDASGWVDHVPALVQAWYPGQEGGRALADVLLGKMDPGGRLPVTFPKRIEDTCAYGNYPGKDGRVDYAEGIFVGYRWFDMKGIQPLFPFGHGLSYTTFNYRNLHVEPTGDGKWTASFEVTNNGSMKGDEVSELYVCPPVTSRVRRPIRELRAFNRESLAPDQTITVNIVLDRSSFSYFDEKRHDWAVEPGSYTVEVGSSSRDILLDDAVPVD